MKVKYYSAFNRVLGRSRNKLIPLVILFLLVGFLDLVGIGLLGPFLLAVSNKTEVTSFFGISIFYDELLFLSLVLLGMYFFKSIFSFLSQRAIVRFAFSLQENIILRIVSSFQNVSYDDFLKKDKSSLITSITNLTMIYTHQSLLAWLRLLSEGIIVILIIALLAYTNITALIYISVLMFVVTLIYIFFVKTRLNLAGENMVESIDKITAFVASVFDGFKELRVYQREDFLRSKLEDATSIYKDSNTTYRIFQVVPKLMFELVMVIFLLLMCALVLTDQSGKEDLIVTLSIFGIGCVRLLPSLNVIISSFNDIRYSGRTLYELDELLTAGNSSEMERLAGFSHGTEGISLENVSFRYGKTKDVLSKVSFVFDGNGSYGIVGPSGSGKSTLIELLMGLHRPTSGKIFSQFSHDEIAYVPQSPFIIDGTIRENVLLDTNNSVSDSDIYDALEKVKLAEFVRSTSQGLDTRLSSDRKGISGGQIQRMALSRMFVHRKKLIILDEVTSAVDAETQEVISKNIDMLKKEALIIMVAHREAALSKCDVIINISDKNLNVLDLVGKGKS